MTAEAPPAPSRISPEPVSDSTSVVPSRSTRATLLAATVMPVEVFVNARSAVNDWPATATVTPSAVTET